MRVLALLLLTAAPALAEGDLFIYTWGEYTPPDLVAKFEAEFGVKVHIDSYDSMETMIAKLRAGGAGYDIIVPGDATMQVLIAEGMVEKIDVFAMPNFANVDDRWREVYWDPKREYSAPWAWGSTAFAVDTAVVTGDTSSLAVLFEPAEEVKGRINMLRDMNDVINMAERYLGVPRCSDNPDDDEARAGASGDPEGMGEIVRQRNQGTAGVGRGGRVDELEWLCDAGAR